MVAGGSSPPSPSPLRALLSIGLPAGVSISGGVVCGSSIGFVPVYLVLQKAIHACDMFRSSHTCPESSCVWFDATSQCIYPDEVSAAQVVVTCAQQLSERACGDLAHVDCQWQSGACEHVHGFTTVETGLFAGALVFGAVFGSAAASAIWGALGRHNSALLLAAVMLLGTGANAAGVFVDAFALLAVSRVVIGVGMGIAHVVAPLLVNESVALELRGAASALFQTCFQLGIALPATLGLAMTPEAPLAAQGTLELQAASLLVIPTFAAVGLVVVVAALKKRHAAAADGDYDALDDDDGRVEEGTMCKSAESPKVAFIAGLKFACAVPAFRRCVLTALALSCAQQLTGINAILTYAPMITHDRLGLEGLEGSCIVTWWNVCCSLTSIVVAPRFTKRRLYLGGLATAGCALVVCGITTLPSVSGAGADAATATKVVSAIALAVYIAAFNLGMASMFWTLAAEIFSGLDAVIATPHDDAATNAVLLPSLPRRDVVVAGGIDGAAPLGSSAAAAEPVAPRIEWKSLGCSVTNTIQLSLAMLLLVAFPPAQRAFGAGSSAPKLQGLGVLMLCFAAVAVASLVALFHFLRPPESRGGGGPAAPHRTAID